MSIYQFKRQHTLLLALGVLTVLLAGCGVPGTIAAGGHLPPVPASPTPTVLPPVRFPQDEAPHRNLTEWWYYTGHLNGKDSSGKAHLYGFEFVIFQSLRGDFPPVYAAHFAISDITAGTFHYDQRQLQEPDAVIPNGTSTTGFHLALGDWTMQGLNGHDQLQASMTDYQMMLDLRATKPAVLHGGNGLITNGLNGFSYYYSRTRMPLTGTVVDHGAAVQVTGLAWMDHQWGNFLSLVGGGWDWYSIQLADDTEIMMYFIRDPSGKIAATYATHVSADGEESILASKDFTSQALSTWTSPVTHATYPSGWQVTITSLKLSLTLTPQLRDQELVTTATTGAAYWEGAVAIEGQEAGQPISGQGHVELTGYAPAA
ncbi:MAG TPA: lipocalin-like domain-containing protein [Ktedonobacterales bacterium]|nr:lipocalin-like domain-containing protein [Ktedonobacterales bacterium]